MSCAKKDCCSRRREEMLDAATLLNLGEKGAKMVSQLLAVAKTGAADMLSFPDAMTQTLALEIMSLWRDAQIAKLFDVPEVTVNKQITDVTIKFGPGKQYKLILPVIGPTTKKELAESLRATAAILDPLVVDLQLPLPFDAQS